MDIANLASTIFYFLIVLGVLVLVHEIGHYVFAKRFGVRVEEFGIGYPPRAVQLWKERGWIQIQGKQIVIPRRFKLPPGVQAGAWVTYQTRLDESHEVLAAIEPVEPERRGVTAASQVQALEPGTIYTLNWLPLGGFVRMTGEENPSDPRSFAAQRPLARSLILVAGAGMNVVLAVVLFTLIATAPQVKTIEVVTIEAVSPNSPAESAGIRPGDQLVTINGQPIENRQDAQRIIYGQAGQEISIELKRGNQQLTVPVTPRVNPPRDEGPTGIRLCTECRVLAQRAVNYPLWEAFPLGIARTWETAGAIFTGFRRLAQGTAPQGSVGGPVEIGRVTGLACQAGLLSCMEFTALLSVNLAVINLFPFPALDGGRLMFVILEGLRRGKRIAPEKEGLVHFVGMAILLLLMVLITFNDVRRLFGSG